MHKQVTPIISAFVQCFADTQSHIDIAMQAMNSMEQIFRVINDEYASTVLINVCMSLKSLLENKEWKMRECSIRLYGILGRFGKGQCAQSLIQQVYVVLPSLIVHLHDESEEVQTVGIFIVAV